MVLMNKNIILINNKLIKNKIIKKRFLIEFFHLRIVIDGFFIFLLYNGINLSANSTLLIVITVFHMRINMNKAEIKVVG